MPELSAFAFAWPWMILALPLAGLIWWWLPAGVTHAPQIPFAETWRAASGEGQWRQWRQPSSLLMLAGWLCLVLALMRPQLPGDRQDILLSGRQMMLLVDLSLSMSIEDMVIDGEDTDRLVAVQAVLDDFIPRRDGDQMGLIVFGSQAYLHVPMTPDLNMVRQLVREMEIGMAGPRTALGEAIALGVLHLADTADPEDRVMVLLSDGAQTIGNVFPPEASVLARDNDVTIYSIGFGTETAGGGSDIDERSLTLLAESTGGAYYRARSSADLNEIYSAIDELEPTDSAQRAIRHARDVFHWPAGAGLSLILLAGLWQSIGQWPGRSLLRRRSARDEVDA